MTHMEITILTVLIAVYFFIELLILLYYIRISFGIKAQNGDDFDYLFHPTEAPFVSIIVPTYNEESNIGKCLQSLKSLEYSNYEIILVDGGSKDDTVNVARQYISPDHVIISNKLPDGWIGKSWACHLGYQASRGEILLFTDADTEHKPQSLARLIKIQKDTQSGLLTLLPYQKLKKYWESIVPIYYFMSHIASGGGKSVNNHEKKDSFLGSGQYLLFTRQAYEAIGGHEAIKGSIIEDYAFAKVAKNKLGSLYYLENHRLVSAHMYPESFNHCWTGIKKVLFAGTKLTTPRHILISTLFVLWGIISPVAVFIALYRENPFYLIITTFIYVINLLAFAKYWHNKGDHYFLSYLLMPILLVVFVIAMIFSALEIMIGKTTKWKGITYKPDMNAGLN